MAELPGQAKSGWLNPARVESDRGGLGLPERAQSHTHGAVPPRRMNPA